MRNANFVQGIQLTRQLLGNSAENKLPHQIKLTVKGNFLTQKHQVVKAIRPGTP